MGGDRGQAVLTPLLRRQRHSIALPVEFEPQDRSSEDAALPQIVPDPGFNGAEVLANHDSTRPMGLQRENADHGLMVVTNIAALSRMRTPGNPPQSEQANDM